MDLSIFFASVESIATSLERIADQLESRAAQPAAGQAPAEKPTRRRRSKEEIAADEAQAQALVQSGTAPATTTAAPGTHTAAPAAPLAPPVAAAPASVTQTSPASSPPVVAATAAPAATEPAALPRPVAGVGEAYHVYSVQDQFTNLNLLVGPYFTSAPSVKQVLLDTLAKHGVGLPLSEPTDGTRSTPGANFTGMSNLARIEVYENCARAIDAVNAANL
jgi:hypothetical protein